MIYNEDGLIKLGGVILPGVIKKFEIKAAALIEEVEVEGSTSKPKQATGYEDAKITIELIVDDTSGEKSIRKIERIQSLFKKAGQTKPQPLSIVSQETSSAGINKVLLKDFNVAKTNKSVQYTATLEFWQYIPMTITAAKSKSGTGGAPVLNPNYQSYLNSDRGSAPKLSNKTGASPATDNVLPSCGSFLDRIGR